MEKTIHDIAERLRQEPFHALTNNCAMKSLRFKKACKEAGIDAAVVLAICIVELKRFGLHAKLPFVHVWAYTNHERVEVARPLDQKCPWGVYDIEFKPIISVWIW